MVSPCLRTVCRLNSCRSGSVTISGIKKIILLSVQVTFPFLKLLVWRGQVLAWVLGADISRMTSFTIPTNNMQG